MTERANSNVSLAQSIGRVEGQLEAVSSMLTGLVKSLEEQRKISDEQRAALAAGLEIIEAEVKALRADMNEVKPITEKLERWQSVGFGALMVVGVVCSAIGASIAFFKEKIIAAIFGG